MRAFEENLTPIALIVPVYNEEKNIPIFWKAFVDFNQKVEKRGYRGHIWFIDDGSSDDTALVLNTFTQEHPQISSIYLSRNFGKEAALFAGLTHAKGDLYIPMDVDLQDPFEVIFEMLDKYEEGAEVVLAQRSNRNNDTFFKKKSAEWFYRLNNQLSSIPLEKNVGDFRLMTKQVVDEITKLDENQLFMKGLMSWVGFKTVKITYERPIRSEGKTKFNFIKLWKLAVQGITSFSTVPLSVWVYFGTMVSFLSFLYGLKIIIEKLFFGINVSGYASLMVAILFFGGVQLIGIGVLGEYIGRIYLESKRRPKFIIKKIQS